MPENYVQAVHRLTAQIPRGRLATYGQIARLIPGCNPRMVGYALAALPENSDVPWQRVINRLGTISERNLSDGHLSQKQLLEKEGIAFDANNRADLKQLRHDFS
ncbi:MAG: MGMT family protein [Planctomycetota bacterium]|jgi:methylated-DNA-protein-cysteine methyltransferase-like protein